VGLKPRLDAVLEIPFEYQVGNLDVILLIPNIISDDGEWESWNFATWMPGEHRYLSFEQLMVEAYSITKLI
jgi:hypothetical protein